MEHEIAAPPYFAYRNDDTIRMLDRHRPIGDSVVFVFFDPWAIGCRVHRDLLAAMEAQGFTPVAYAAHQLTEADIEQMYRRNLPIRADNSWHVAKEVYLTGTSLGVLLHRHQPGVPATLAMQAIKGKSNPALGRSGQLRYDGRAPNRSLSLMHSSDDWAATLYESIVFFDAPRLDAVFDAIAAEEWRLSADDTCPLVEGCLTISDPSPVRLLLRLRLRAARVLRAAGLDHEVLDTLIALWRDSLEAIDRDGPVVESVNAYLQMVKREAAGVTALCGDTAASPHTPPRLYHRSANDTGHALLLLSVLAAPQSYVLIDADELCRASALFVDRWEELLFKTTLFNFDDFLEQRR